ncbi:hypothetical protein [Saccharothrix sp.]|uniref:hypothetical protein n=1 Tax=Saccharothrix sp. TaxID=1873460 RepID=UPI002811FDAB|nr:hypothetical protein [Saccharothrix sp.]
MSVSDREPDVPPPVHLGVQRLLDTVRQQAELPWFDAAGEWDDPLFDAWLSCLEAATTVGRAFSAQHARTGSDEQALIDELRGALSATRAAAASIRYSLVDTTDRERRS